MRGTGAIGATHLNGMALLVWLNSALTQRSTYAAPSSGAGVNFTATSSSSAITRSSAS